jgi:hypothetical protein
MPRNSVLASWPSDQPFPAPPGPAEYPAEKRPECQALLDSSDLLTADRRLRDPDAGAELRRRSAEQGYLYFRGLLDSQEVLAVRREFVRVLRSAGWLDVQQDDSELGTKATTVPLGTKLEGQEQYLPVLRAYQSLECFHQLARSPNLVGVLDGLFDEPTFVHPRNIGRIILPRQNAHKTMPHQDWIHTQGCPQTMTGWLPLGEVPPDDGGLAILEGSCTYGLRRHYDTDVLGLAGGAGGIGVTVRALEEAGCRWVTTHYLPGDVLLFNSLTVHQALPNLGDSLRLSVDFRYSGLTKGVVPDGLLPHTNIAPWSELYSGTHAAAAADVKTSEWVDPTGQFYWAAAGGGRPALVQRIPGHFVGPASSDSTEQFVSLHAPTPNVRLSQEARDEAIAASVLGDSKLDPRESRSRRRRRRPGSVAAKL